MITLETKVSDIITRAPEVKSFRFKLKEDIQFKPGQFFLVTIKITGKEETKHFSFSNSPTEKGYIEFTKRITQSVYSQALDKLKPGDWVRLKLPLGSFTFTGEYEKIALLSGGIGITPLRSICKFAADKRLSTDIALLFGNNRKEDIIFKDDFDRLAADNRNIRVVYTLTAEGIDKESWPGRRGFIDAAMIREEIPDHAERMFYLCGPPRMVGTLRNILINQLDIGEDKIRLENFSGY